MKNKKLINQILEYAAERGINIPADILLDMSRQEAKALLDQLKVTIEIKPEDLPLFTMTQPGAVPAPKAKDLILSSDGWTTMPKPQRSVVYAGGAAVATGGAAHDAVTVTDTASVDLTLTGQNIKADVLPAGVDHNTLANINTGNGTMHVPANGASTQVLQYSAAGTAKWSTISGDASLADGGVLGVNKTRLNVRNETGVTIASTKAVYMSGFNNLPLISLIDNTDETKHNLIGITIAPINHEANGFIATNGQFDAETNTWNVGTELYISTAGNLTSTEPTSGTVRHAGIVTVKANYPVGKILIYTQPEEYVIGMTTGKDMIQRMGDDIGVNKISWRDYSNNEVGSINSDGALVAASVNGLTAAQATDLTDGGATALHSHAAAFQFPVGYVYISIDGTNPNTVLGYGTWAAFGAGRVLVGLDAADPNFDVVEETGGAKTVASSAQTFAGNALGTHQHDAITAGTPAGTISYPVNVPAFSGTQSTTVVNHLHTLATGTGASGNFSQVIGTVDTTSGGTGGTPTQTALGTLSGNPTAGGAASYTPAGTIAWPANPPTFAGNALGTHQHAAITAGTPAGTNTPGAATSVVQPYIVVYMFKRTA